MKQIIKQELQKNVFTRSLLESDNPKCRGIIRMLENIIKNCTTDDIADYAYQLGYESTFNKGMKKEVGNALRIKALEIFIIKQSLAPIRVECRRWFQKSYGNTYHSVKVILSDGSSHVIPFEYGYDEQCLQTAREFLVNNGIILDSKVPTWQFFKDNNIEYTIADVNRKKDLHSEGA